MSLTDRLSRNTGAWNTPQRRPQTPGPGAATPTHAAQPAPGTGPAPAPGVTPCAPPTPSAQHAAQRPMRPASPDATGDEYYTVKAKLHERLIERIDLAAVERLDPEELGRRIAALVERILAEDFRQAPLNMAERQRIISEMRHEVLGLGPLEPLLQDPAVSDILVNGYAQVYVERRGKLERTDTRFQDDAHLRQIIERIVSRMGRRIDESSPMVDARLEDGSRVNAIIPPLAIDGPSLSIRRFSRDPLELDDLIAFSALTREIGDVLRGIVRARLNILISGGTGSGKTTLLNVLSRFVPHDERIVTIEDAAELQLKQDHVVRLETRPANLEGRGEITARDLVKNCLRMRPDRIIVGEVRGAEVLDMLQAMNTGHDGSLTTVHANTPRDALMRIETMTAMAGLNLTGESTKRTIASAIDVIIQATRLGDGTRKLISVQEITGMEGPAITMQEIFRFRQTGVTATHGVRGVFESMGIRPKFAQRLSALGVELDADLFRAGTLLSVGEETP
ncbi:ATPase, T2SS/T4P/T4SS family [Desulfobaculum sp. SPO524]|uniref:ATPase, T2SS/T4P/T4SS family n=1 Tax=Desulfobaculum sp. SPO524 TaxID=3378071 RepID=UPI003853910C